MGWNCFKSSGATENEEAGSVGETLREKFPGLFRLIQRIKDLGAPTKLKRKFRRKRRTPKDVDSSSKDKLSKSKRGASRSGVSRTDGRINQDAKVSRPPTGAPAKEPGKNVLRIIVTPASVSQRVGYVSPDDEDPWGGLTPDWVVVNDPKRFGVNLSDTSQDELCDSELDTVAGELVDHVLRKLTSPTTQPSQSSDSTLVDHVLMGVTSPTIRLSQSPDSDLEALADSLVDHVLSPAVQMSSSASLVGPSSAPLNKTPLQKTSITSGGKVGNDKCPDAKAGERFVADKEVGIIPKEGVTVDATSTDGDKSTNLSASHIRRAHIPPQASHSADY